MAGSCGSGSIELVAAVLIVGSVKDVMLVTVVVELVVVQAVVVGGSVEVLSAVVVICSVEDVVVVVVVVSVIVVPDVVVGPDEVGVLPWY